MAHSAWMIPRQPENIAQSAINAAKKVVPAKNGDSFAAVMAREQMQNATQSDSASKKNGLGAAQASANSQQQPRVAQLPQTGLPVRGNTVLAGRTPNDMLRMQNFNNASADLRQTRAINGFMESMGATGATALDLARNMGAANNLRTIAANGNGAGFALSASDYIHTSSIRRAAGTNAVSRKNAQTAQPGLGKLSARFESGSEGIAAIGYDSTGGTSYGKYQIASRVGSMKAFLNFLDEEAPDLSKRLRAAGPANTGSRKGRMPDEWRAIAKEQPERFEQLQEGFIHQSHYKPALDAIAERTGIDPSSLSAAMREVIWSTAVQHGPAGAAKIFARADNMSGKSEDAGYERKLITNVYNVRAGQFGSSTAKVREAVRSRFKQEKQLALNMLESNSISSLA